MDPATHGRCSTAHRFKLGPPSASRPVFIGTIRNVRTSVCERAQQWPSALSFPPSGVSRVRARAQWPARPRGEKALFSRIGRDFYFVGRPTGLLVSTVSRLEHV